MDNWNRQVEKWKRWTEAKEMAVELEYWGEHELLTRLSLEEHRAVFSSGSTRNSSATAGFKSDWMKPLPALARPRT